LRDKYLDLPTLVGKGYYECTALKGPGFTKVHCPSINAFAWSAGAGVGSPSKILPLGVLNAPPGVNPATVCVHVYLAESPTLEPVALAVRIVKLLACHIASPNGINDQDTASIGPRYFFDNILI
jgi:hypothetical protein